MPLSKTSISNVLITISILATFALILNPDLGVFGMNRFFLEQQRYEIYILQFFSSLFLHGGFLHLAFNSLFIYYFGNMVEMIVGRKAFFWFFVVSAVWIGTTLTYLQPYSNTIGMSGFALGLLSYYALEMRSKAQFQESGGAVTCIIINIFIGFVPGVSLVGHVAGIIIGVIFYYLHTSFFTPKYIGTTKTPEAIFGSKGVSGEMNMKD